MRIGLDVTKAMNPRDGVGNYTVELVRALYQLPEDDELLLYSVSREMDVAAVEEQFPDRPERCTLRPDTRPQDDGVDLVHVNAFAYPAGFGGPTVVTFYDLTFFTHPELHTLANKVACMTGTLEAILDDATFVSISEAAAREFREHLGVAPERIHVIHPAVAAVYAPRPEEEARAQVERLGITGEFILAVGTLEPRKNLRRLIEAYRGLPAELRERFPLLLAGGSGWKLDEGELLQDGVRRLGFVPQDDLVALYNRATVFAYPSLIEGFGLPVLEAMNCGAPVLTSNVSSLPEVTGDAARQVEPLDVEDIRKNLAEMLTDDGERQRLRQLGFERAKKFSWPDGARRIRALYEEVLGR